MDEQLTLKKKRGQERWERKRGLYKAQISSSSADQNN